MKMEISELVKQIKFKTSTFIALINKLETRRDRKERVKYWVFALRERPMIINSMKKNKQRDLKIAEDEQFGSQRWSNIRTIAILAGENLFYGKENYWEI